jgi:hypothetical protein
VTAPVHPAAGTPAADVDQLADAAEQGRICGLAAQGQRDLQRLAAARPELFPADPFEPMLFANIALAIAFGAPWCDATQLRAANRTVLWGFALDWLVDHVAGSPAEVSRLVDRCRAVADGATPQADDPLGGFLVELEAELAGAPAFAQRRALWRDRVVRTVEAMAREWHWKADGTRPTLDEYLDNADNHACTIVNVAHWLRTGDPATLARLDLLVAASDQVQRALRLVNDLGTYERDLRWGDLNALLLVADPAEVHDRLAGLVAEARRQLDPVRADCPTQVAYLERQLGFSSGFYRLADFWGMA